MMSQRLIRTLIGITLIPFIYSANKIFNATEEWQRVPDDVSIPAGLHVKMDLTNGGRWAKLLDSSDESQNPDSSDFDPNTKMVVVKKEDAIRRDYDFTQEKLANEMAEMGLFKNDDSGDSRPGFSSESNQSEQQKDAEKKIHLEKLKSFMNEVNQKVTTDFEKMNALIDTLEKINDTESDFYVDVCEDLDWIISKVDNAKDAASHGILSRLIEVYKARPSKHIWRIFSASAQNNPPVAKALFKVLKPLIEENVRELEYNSGLLKSAIFALSAITRSLPTEDQMKVDWNSLLTSNNGQNEYLCNLLQDLREVPYNCDRVKTEL